MYASQVYHISTPRAYKWGGKLAFATRSRGVMVETLARGAGGAKIVSRRRNILGLFLPSFSALEFYIIYIYYIDNTNPEVLGLMQIPYHLSNVTYHVRIFLNTVKFS